MTGAERKFLFVVVREVLRRADGSDEIERGRFENKHLPALRSLGFLIENTLGPKAILEYFAGFERIPCPAQVKAVVDSFGMDGIEWRSPRGVITERIDWAGGGGITYRNLKTVFIKESAVDRVWYHEFGHLLYGCVKNTEGLAPLLKRIEDEALVHWAVVTSDGTKHVDHGITNKSVSLPPGRYLLINGEYHGLDHSGGGADGESDELWATLFEQYHDGRVLPSAVRDAMDTMLATLKAMPKPLNPCDPE